MKNGEFKENIESQMLTNLFERVNKNRAEQTGKQQNVEVARLAFL